MTVQEIDHERPKTTDIQVDISFGRTTSSYDSRFIFNELISFKKTKLPCSKYCLTGFKWFILTVFPFGDEQMLGRSDKL
jgi:hypothetical protein